MRELKKLDALMAAVTDRSEIVEELRTKFPDWRAALDANPAVGRQLLRKLIAGQMITVRPHFENGSQCFEYTAVGTLDGLIHGAVGILTWELSEKLGLGGPETVGQTVGGASSWRSSRS